MLARGAGFCNSGDAVEVLSADRGFILDEYGSDLILSKSRLVVNEDLPAPMHEPRRPHRPAAASPL